MAEGVSVRWEEVPGRRVEVGPMCATWTDLGKAGGSVATGLKRIQIEPGRRSTPVHVHDAEEEIFYVLGGDGLSWQDGETCAVAAGDCIVHVAGGAAHTLIAGERGARRPRLRHAPRRRRWRGCRAPACRLARAELGRDRRRAAPLGSRGGRRRARGPRARRAAGERRVAGGTWRRSRSPTATRIAASARSAAPAGRATPGSITWSSRTTATTARRTCTPRRRRSSSCWRGRATCCCTTATRGRRRRRRCTPVGAGDLRGPSCGQRRRARLPGACAWGSRSSPTASGAATR